MQQRIEQLAVTGLIARGVGNDFVEGTEHAEQFHLGHQISGNGGTHRSKLSWVEVEVTEAVPQRWRGANDVTQHGITGTAHDLATSWRLKGLFASLIEQRLEVRDAELAVAAHARDRSGDALAGELVAAAVDLLGAQAHEALTTSQVCEDIGC